MPDTPDTRDETEVTRRAPRWAWDVIDEVLANTHGARLDNEGIDGTPLAKLFGAIMATTEVKKRGPAKTKKTPTPRKQRAPADRQRPPGEMAAMAKASVDPNE